MIIVIVAGSHDTHIFRLAKPLDENLLLRLDYPINHWQAENGNYDPSYNSYVTYTV